MAISEAERHTLVTGLIETLGMERTEILMKCILPDGWQHLATKQDVEVADARLRAAFGELRGEFGELRGEFGELRGEFGELRGEFGELRGEFGELKGEFGELRGEFGELKGEFGELRGELGGLKGYIDSALAKQTRTYMLALVGFAVTIWLTLLLPAIF